MKLKLPMKPLILIAFFILFYIGLCVSMHESNNEKAIVDGKRYSELPIIKTVEKEKGVFYFLGDEKNQVEVNKRYYDLAIKAYKESQREK